MSYIGPAVGTACRAAAALFNRLFIQFIFCIQQIHLAMVCIDMAVPAVSGRIHAVKEINAAVHRL